MSKLSTSLRSYWKLILIIALFVLFVLGLYLFRFGFGFEFLSLSSRQADWASFGSYLSGIFALLSFLSLIVVVCFQLNYAAHQERLNKTFQMLNRWNEVDLRRKRIRFYKIFKDEAYNLREKVQELKKNSSVNGEIPDSMEIYSYLVFSYSDQIMISKNENAGSNFNKVFDQIDNNSEDEEDKFKFNEIAIFFSDLYSLISSGVLDRRLSYEFFGSVYEAWFHCFVYMYFFRVEDAIEKKQKTIEHRPHWILRKVLPLFKEFGEIERENVATDEELLFDNRYDLKKLKEKVDKLKKSGESQNVQD
ncbi:MAG: hypothetical protein AAF901_04520 [Bacteroidota bacterium]